MPASGNRTHGSTGIDSPPPSRGLGRLRTFQALEERDFRRLWAVLSISAVGTGMQIVALSLLVLDLTHGSAFALGTVSLAQAVAFLVLAPVGGTFADRLDRRRLLLVTQSAIMTLALLLGVLTATGAIRFWMIPVLAFSSSAMLAFDQPTRNALIASLVSKRNLMNAMALQSAVFNGASILGPALAGLALSRIGYAGNFFLNAASFLGVLLVLARLRSPAAEPTLTPDMGHSRGISSASSSGPSGSSAGGRPGGHPEGWFASFAEALHHVRRDAVLPFVVLSYGALLFFAPSAAMMLPLFTRQVIHVGPTQLGALFSAIGVGAVCGALITASLGDFQHKGPLVFGSIMLFAAALALFGLSSSLLVAMPLLFLLGAAQNAAGATTITLLQTQVPAWMRGRAMSLNTLLIMSVRPLGDFPIGAVIGRLGFRPAVLLSAAVVGVATLVLMLTRHRAVENGRRS
ncbi:MAG TPA: MFS transporter [Terriglobia bacterium]|nr:MFS transporter [Terriglobia bacterium]